MSRSTNIRGVIHGRIIQLEEDVSVPDGAVTVTITSLEQLPQSKTAQTKLEAAAGSLAGLDDEIDEFNRWYREARHNDPRDRRTIE